MLHNQWDALEASCEKASFFKKYLISEKDPTIIVGVLNVNAHCESDQGGCIKAE